jgi:GT2 family glycosyltransferase
VIDLNLPMLSLVILSFNKFGTTTGPCLDSLMNSLKINPLVDVEWILVDNDSQDGSAAQCRQFAQCHPDVKFLPQKKNLGFSGGMNAGVLAARGQWVCLINSDTLFPLRALSVLMSTLKQAPPELAMIGPVTNAAGNGQCLSVPDVDLSQMMALGEVAMSNSTGLLIPTYRSDFFCVAIRRDVWHQLKGLDPVFGLGYYEDFDFSLRLTQLGWHQAIAEDVFVAHVGSSSFKGMGAAQNQLLRRNRALLRQRHPRAKLEHLRVGNAQALRYLVDSAMASGWTTGLRQRAAWRLAALLQNEPRSPFKRWRWRWSHHKLRADLAQAGVEPQFPRVDSGVVLRPSDNQTLVH